MNNNNINIAEPMFSVVVTCYNVAPFIQEVLASIQMQTYEDFEIIAVDDGSPDKCGEILDKCAKLDSRIKVIHQKNGGPGAARNTGVNNASGKYIFFLDGDDRMVEDTLKIVSEKINADKPDIIASTLHIYTDWEKTYYRKEKLNRIKDNSSLKLKLAQDTYLSHNFYLREMIVKNNRPFGEERKLAEDQEWILNNIHAAKSIEVVDTAFYYHYERRPGSQVNGFSDEKIIPTVLTWAKMYRDIDGLNYSVQEKAILKHRTSSVFLKTLVLRTLGTKNKEIGKEGRQIFRDNYDIIICPYNKMRLAGYLSKVIGVYGAMTICKVYYTIKNKALSGALKDEG